MPRLSLHRDRCRAGSTGCAPDQEVIMNPSPVPAVWLEPYALPVAPIDPQPASVETSPVAVCPSGRGSARRHTRNQRGMVTAEWAVGIIAAIAVAGVLLAIVTSGPVHDVLLKFILSVIHQFSGGFAKLR